MTFVWPQPVEEISLRRAASLATRLGIRSITANLLVRRGFGEEEQARRFLEPRLRPLRPPRGRDAAVAGLGGPPRRDAPAGPPGGAPRLLRRLRGRRGTHPAAAPPVPPRPRAVGRALPDPRELLDLVALGTVADLVPLTDENRVLVAAGLRELARSRRPGIRALLQVAQLPDDRPLSTQDVSFRLAPL